MANIKYGKATKTPEKARITCSVTERIVRFCAKQVLLFYIENDANQSIYAECFPTLIKWTSPFPILGLLDGIFHFFIQILKETSISKQWRI